MTHISPDRMMLLIMRGVGLGVGTISLQSISYFGNGILQLSFHRSPSVSVELLKETDRLRPDENLLFPEE